MAHKTKTRAGAKFKALDFGNITGSDSGSSKGPVQQIFGGFNKFLSSPIGGFILSQFTANEQRQINEATREQQENVVGQQAGTLGLSPIPGIPTIPSSLDITQFPGQAQSLADRLSRLSSGESNQARARAFRAFGTDSPINKGLAGLQGDFQTANQATLDEFGQQAGGITGQFQAGAQGLQQQFGAGAAGLQSQFAQGAAGINQGFQDRLRESLGILEGAGQQASEDISTRFQESLGNQQQALAARGFGGSTLGSNLALGSAREESAEQRRLQEQLRQQRLGTFANLSGQALGAQQGLLGAGTSLGQGLLGFGTSLGQGLLGAGTNLQAGFAGQGLAAGQAGNQFGANLGFGALQAQSGNNQFLQNFLQRNVQQNLDNQFRLGQFPIGVGQQAAQTQLNALGQLDIRNPQQLQPFQVQPPVR